MASKPQDPGVLLIGAGVALSLLIAFYLGMNGEAGQKAQDHSPTRAEKKIAAKKASPQAGASAPLKPHKTYQRPKGPLPNPLANPRLNDRLRTRTMRKFHFRDHPGQPTRLVLKDRDGQKIPLENWRGKTFLLTFWTPWCDGCRRELPSFEKLKHILRHQQFDIVLANIDKDSRKGEAFLDKLGISTLIRLNDPKKAALKELVAAGVPTTILFDCHGRELGRISGSAIWYSDSAVLLIKAMMRGSGCYDAKADAL